MAVLFDPGAWIVLPRTGGQAIHRADMGPCSCGNALFSITEQVIEETIETPDGSIVRSRCEYRTACPHCVRLKLGEDAIGVIDMYTGRIA